jgi:hypothetical protein
MKIKVIWFFWKFFEKIDTSNSGRVGFEKGLEVFEVLYNAGHIRK